MTDDDEDDIFARWSRRKRRVAEEERVEIVKAAPEAPASEPPAEDEDESALLERLGLPVPESLKAGDDFSAFMRAGVPEFLRRRALRVLWKSNPILANLDGLNDYDADFTSPELTKKILATGYRIGRGFLIEPSVPEILQENDKETQTASVDATELPEENTAVLESPPRSVPEPSTALSEAAETEEFSFNPKRMRFET